MLDIETRRRIDNCRDILVGKVPDPKGQVEQITIALIYKFMDDMDKQSVEMGGKPAFFAGEFAKYSWSAIFDPRISGYELLNLYGETLTKMNENPKIPQLFRDIFKNAFLPYRDPETLRSFLKEINNFTYDHSERLGDAFEYLLSVLSSQGDAGQFRTPRHIIGFIVEVIDPKPTETVLDPACGTAGFLISAYKHILKQNPKLSSSQKKRLMSNFTGYDISYDMVRLSLVNMYLHSFPEPHIHEYDTLTYEDRWDETADVIMANPPFMSPKGGIRPHKRFSIQANRSEVLFVDYIAEHLNPGGRAGVIVPEGIIFQSAGAYKQLRKMLVENYLYAVVSLPAGIFNPYSGVKTSILFMDRSIAKKTDQILFVKIENDGYGLGTQRREQTGSDLPDAANVIGDYVKAVRSGTMDAFKPEEKPCGALLVSKEKLAANGDHNLSGERYREGAVKSQHYPSYPLSEVCDIFNGSTPSKQEPRYWENGTVPWFTVEDIRKCGRIIEKTEKCVTNEALKKTSLKLLPKHSVLLCCTASVGEYAFTEIEVATNQQFNGLVVNRTFTDRLLPKFLFFISSRFKDELLRLSGKTAFNFVSVGTLKTIEIPLPPLEVQHEIVAEIEGYQKLIDGSRQVVENWKPQIEIAPDWPMVRLGDVCEVIAGQSPDGKYYNDKAEGTPFYQGKTEFSEKFIGSPVKWTTQETKIAEKDDILMSVRAPVGPVNISTQRICIGRGLAAIRPSKKVLMPFVFTFLKTKEKEIKGNGGAVFDCISRKDIEAIQILLPPLEVQREIVAKIEAERKAVDGCRELIALYETKIKQVIDKVWEG